MAESILRLKVNSEEYDNKLKRAAEGIQRYADGCRKAGGTLEHLDDGVEQFVKELGKMETTSNSAKGKINEMTKAFTDLSVEYKHLTDQEKQAPFGNALAQSLDQLKTRVQSAKQDLDDIHKSLNGATSGGGGGLFGGGKLDGMLQVFGGNLMTKGASMLAGFASEIGNCIEQGIELAKQGEGIHLAFNRLNQPGLLDNLREATHGTVTDLELMKAAVKFNDFKLPLDQLGTMLAFAQKKAKDTGQSVDYMVDSIVTGLGRKSLMILDNLGLSAAEIRDKMKETGDMTKAVGEIIRDQMSKAGDYVETAADRAQQANVNLQNKMEELGRKFGPLQEASNNLWTSMKIGILDVVSGPLTNFINKLTMAGRLAQQYGVLGGSEKVGRLTQNLANSREANRHSIYQQQQEQFWRYINPREQQIKDIRAWQRGERGEALQSRINAIRDKYGSLDATKIQAEVDAAKKMLSDYQQAAKTILQPIKQEIVPTVTPTGGGSGKGGDDKSVDIDALIRGQYDTAMLKGSNAGVKALEVGGPSEAWNAYVESIKQGSSDAKDSLSGLEKAFESLNKSEGVNAIGNLSYDAKGVKSSFKDAASAIGMVGNALNSIEDPTARIMGIVAQAIATIAMAYSEALAKDKTNKSNIWYFIATAGAAMASMATTISSIHSATGYKNGGMVRGYASGGMADGTGGGSITGTTYSNDQIPILANAGEVILNKAQQSTLAASIQANGGGGIRIIGVLKGEDLVLSADRWGMRTGRGELLFAKNL